MKARTTRITLFKHYLPIFAVLLVLLTTGGYGADIIIDNSQPGTSSTGTWAASARCPGADATLSPPSGMEERAGRSVSSKNRLAKGLL